MNIFYRILYIIVYSFKNIVYLQIVGVGTNDFDLKSSEDKYCSLIGSDNKSWGYSYMGKLICLLVKLFKTDAIIKLYLCMYIKGVKHHDGERSAYGLKFDKSKPLIGVRLDMWRGTLEFFHNRKPLGMYYRFQTIYIIVLNVLK